MSITCTHTKKNNTTQHSKHGVKKKKKCGPCDETWKNDYPGFTDGSQWPNLERDKWPLVTNNRLSVIFTKCSHQDFAPGTPLLRNRGPVTTLGGQSAKNH